jgi:RNA recognition motif-containing protein
MTQPKSPKTPTKHSTKLFIGSLNSKPNKAELETHFSRFGKIQHLQLIKDKHHKHQYAGFGFVTYHHDEDARSCLAQTHFH